MFATSCGQRACQVQAPWLCDASATEVGHVEDYHLGLSENWVYSQLYIAI